MLKTVLCTVFMSVGLIAVAQDGYWQQELNYNIEVKLDDKKNALDGKISIDYKNNSPETLEFIWFHIWPNAYKNDKTALFQQLKNDPTNRDDVSGIAPGFIDGLKFTVGGKVAKTEPHSNPDYIDIVKLILPKPLQPGTTISIATPFHVQLPSYFSRSGFADGQFMVTQWYPKPAVYDKSGWHEFPYLSMGEYYSEYANYNVKISLPGDYVVGATGVLQDKKELDNYKSIGAKNAANRDAQPALYSNQSASKTLNYTASKVPDFAWFAEKNIVIQYDTLQLPSGKLVDAFTYYKNKPGTIWNNSIDYAKDATRFYSKSVGEYEYPTVQVFEGPKNNSSGGMEYPMITLITVPDASKEYLDGVIAHEIGHNWFMSMLGSNERAHTWQDEGLNTYYQFRYEAEKYRYNSIFRDQVPPELKKFPLERFQEAIYGAMRQIPMEGIIDQPAGDFKSSEEYGLVSYIKTALWVYELEKQVGKVRLDEAFQHYFKQWHDKHPQPEDLKASFEKTLGTNLDAWFQKLETAGPLQ